MITRKATLPPTPKIEEGKEAVVNSIKLKPTSRTKVRYTSHKMILLKKAIQKSMEKKGGKEAEFAKTMRIIKPKRSSPKRPRRLAFRIRPSRLSTMSNSQDLLITQPGKGPIVIDLEQNNKESLISEKRPRRSAIKETSGRKPFRDTSNDKILLKKVIKKSTEKKGGKEAVVNSIKLNPTSRTKVRYTSHKMILLKKAIKKSMEKKGGKEAEFAKIMRIIKPIRSSPKRPRRLAFKIRPSRLSTMSNSQDLPITKPGKGPMVIDLEENKESLISKKRPRSPSAIKLNGPSYPKMSNISMKQSAEVALTLDIKMRTKRAKFSQQGPKENVATPDLQMNRATPSTTNVVGSSIPEQSQSPKINKKPSLKATLTSIERKMRTKTLKSSLESQKEKVLTPNPLTTRATRSSTTNDYVFLYIVR